MKAPLMFIASALVIIGCGQQAQQQQEQAPPVTVETFSAKPGTGRTEVSFPGTVEGQVNVDIRSQVSGYLDQIYVQEGQFVNKGDKLFKINDRPLQEQLRSAGASLKNAESAAQAAELEVSKVTPLVKAGIVKDVQLKTATANYEAAKAQVDQARANVQSARINAGFSLITAPVSGYLGRIPKRIGNLISATDQQALTTLSDIRTVNIYFSMSESEYLLAIKGDGTRTGRSLSGIQVGLELADGSVFGQKGELGLASGQIEQNTGSVSMKAVFSNPQSELRSGSRVRVKIHTDLKNIIVVPMAATKELQNKSFVLIAGKDNKVSMRPIVIAGSDGQNFFVKDGLNAGDRIIAKGLDQLQEGAQVTVKMVTAPAQVTE